jgi:hypothetical protein
MIRTRLCQHLVAVMVCGALLMVQLALGSTEVMAFGVRPRVMLPPNQVVSVQAAPGLNNPQRNCQTLRNCQFSKGGSFRGCVSSYSCRVCRYVVSKCSVGATTGKCERQVCEWG